MRYASVCSGVEAASLAWMPLGWKAVWFSEIDSFPCAVLKERFPDVPNLGDMTEIKGEKYYGTVDLLVGGTPCQGFSVAGKQGGLNDPRSALCLAYCGLLETMRPRWFVWENVPGVFSTNQGDDFRAFLGKIDEIGYSVAWRVLDAQYVRVDGFPRAVPQRRRRVFVVGHLGDWRYPASVLFEPGCLPGDTPPRRVKRAGVARSLTASTGGASGKEQQHTFISGDGRPLNALGVDGYNGAVTGKVSATVDTNCKNVDGPTLVMANEQANSEVSEAFSPALTCDHESPIVCAGFSGGQGEKAGGIGYEDEVAPTIRSAESGSNQVPDVVCHENHDAPIAFRWAASPTQGLPIGVDYCHTLMANRNGEPAVCYENHAQDNRIKPCGEYSPQINAKAGTGGCNLPLVQECFPVNSMIIGKNVKVGDRQTTGIGNNGDPLPTISSAHHHAVAVAENIIGRKENAGGNGTGAQVELAYTQNATGVMGVSVNTSVRRLLPVECERLMGFPEVDVLEIGKMTKDEFIAWEISTGNIVVDTENGLVYSTRTGGGRKAEEPILLKGCETPTGYLVVSLREKEDKRQCRIHRIVWIAAHGIPPAGMTIDHIDNNKKNNRLDNLQLMTAVDNSMKAHSDGIVGHKSKITEEQSNEIVTLYQEHAISIRKLAEVYGISKSRVHQLIHRDNWTRIPWRGKSAEDCPDSPRYKACGNSMCVNVMRWIGLRIEKVERRMKGAKHDQQEI